MSAILKPIITEKSMVLANKGWFTFMVDRSARKEQITKQLETQFKVNIVEIKTIHMHGKPQRTGKKRIEVAGSDWKKAIVKLKKDQKIDLFEITTPTK
jgi:large subunit ribosomal protein L23